MGIYAKYIFPRVLDWGLGKPDLNDYRRDALASATGEVLEIGFGTGLNLPHYPPAVKRLVAIDSEVMLPDRVAERIQLSKFPVETLQCDAQAPLPFASGSFDTIVTTFVLCSVARPGLALSEMSRVLRPGGRYLFFEHGLALAAGIQRWQRRLTPINKIIGCGCHLDRQIGEVIRTSGFELTRLNRFALPRAPRLMGELYQGEALVEFAR